MRGEFVDVGGTRLYYYAAGTRGGGDPVLFLHGFPGSSHGWRLLTPLMPEGRRLVIVDLMGCGRSDGPRAAREPQGTVAAHAGLIRRFMDDLNLSRAAIVGHGLGASIAQSIALDDAARVSALCLMSCAAFGAWPSRLARLARLARPFAGLLSPALVAGLVHGSAISGYADRDEGRRSLDQSLRAYPARLGNAALFAHLAALSDPATTMMSARLGELDLPVSVVWGADDPFLAPSVGERLRGAIRGATLDVIPGARHFVAEDAPEQCARVIGELLKR